MNASIANKKSNPYLSTIENLKFPPFSTYFSFRQLGKTAMGQNILEAYNWVLSPVRVSERDSVSTALQLEQYKFDKAIDMAAGECQLKHKPHWVIYPWVFWGKCYANITFRFTWRRCICSYWARKFANTCFGLASIRWHQLFLSSPQLATGSIIPDTWL